MKRYGIYVILFMFCCAKNTLAQVSQTYNENIKQAEQLAQNKQYLQAAQAYSKAFLSNHNLNLHGERYNAARCWALANESDSALYQLKMLAKKGYPEYFTLFADTAFISLQNTGQWLALTEIVKQNKFKQEKLANSSYSNINKPLVAILDTMEIDDQLYRFQTTAAQEKYGPFSEKVKALYKLTAIHDSVNRQKIKVIIDKYGWLGKEALGDQGNETLWLVVQHADLAMQVRCLPLMRAAVKQGKANVIDLSMLEDRVARRQGKKQIYGSQLAPNIKTGKYYVQPIKDVKNVDKRRIKIGLDPMKSYVSRYGIDWSIEQYEKDLADAKGQRIVF